MNQNELFEIIEKAKKEKATTLDLSDKDIKTLPAEIGSLTNLKDLRLDNNQLVQVPAEIGNLINLTKHSMLVYVVFTKQS